MRAFVNQNICIFCCLCGGACPDVFTIDSVKRKSVAYKIELTGELLAEARHDESICPVRAIIITDVSKKKLPPLYNI